MRPALNIMYRISGGLAALFLVLILTIVLAQVGLNVADKIAKWFTGAPVGFLIPSYADFAGYFLATATFFALAYSFREGAHIRVNLVLLRLSPGPRRFFEIWSCSMAVAFTGFFTWYTASLTHESWRYNDLSPGLVAIKLWIPQLAMTAGLVMLLIATIDALFQVLRGEEPDYAKGNSEMDLLAVEPLPGDKQ
ncbi:MAG: TRAP transporter small permease subunit [Rhizobiales bacterium]|nr:TRAP transporter small permease subunit [Hyphomicrobiales bacterium]